MEDLDILIEDALGAPKNDPHFEALFQRFYGPYPRKKAPDDARKALKAILKARGEEFIEDIERAVVASKCEWKQQNRPIDKIPYPGSYLRGGQFAGEPDAPTISKIQRTSQNGFKL